MDLLQVSKCESAQWFSIARRSSEENLSTTGITQKDLELTLSLSYLDSHQSDKMQVLK